MATGAADGSTTLFEICAGLCVMQVSGMKARYTRALRHAGERNESSIHSRSAPCRSRGIPAAGRTAVAARTPALPAPVALIGIGWLKSGFLRVLFRPKPRNIAVTRSADNALMGQEFPPKKACDLSPRSEKRPKTQGPGRRASRARAEETGVWRVAEAGRRHTGSRLSGGHESWTAGAGKSMGQEQRLRQGQEQEQEQEQRKAPRSALS